MTADTTAATRAWRWPTERSAWAAIAIIAPVIAAFAGRTMAIDLAYQIRSGALMLSTRSLLDVDVFTFTVSGHQWLNQQWGAQILLAGAHGVAGWSGIAVMRGVVVGATLVFVYLGCRASGASSRTACLLTLAGWLIGIEILPEFRPQAFGTLLFSICLWVVCSRASRPGLVWLVPALIVAWVNLHGSFPLAFVLLGFAWLEDQRAEPSRARRIALATAAGLLATAVNPYGFRVWIYVVELWSHPVVSRLISEWGPPSLGSWSGRFLFASLFATLVFLARRGVVTGWVTLFKLLVFALIALFAIRGVVWWGLVLPVVLAGLIGDSRANHGEERSPGVAAILLTLVALVVVSLPLGRGIDPITGGPDVLRFAPERLVAAARDNVPEGSRAFVSQLFSSWSEFAAPGLPVFVDPRIEIFPERVWDDYFAVSEGRDGWSEILKRWGVDVLVLHPDQAEHLLAVIRDDPSWARIAGDPESGWVYVRR